MSMDPQVATTESTPNATPSISTDPEGTKDTPDNGEEKKAKGPFEGLRRLPEVVLEAQYVRRTKDVLERRRERVAKLRADTREDIRDVFREIDRDVRQGVERIEGTARKRADQAWKDFTKTAVGKHIDGLFNRKAKGKESETESPASEATKTES